MDAKDRAMSESWAPKLHTRRMRLRRAPVVDSDTSEDEHVVAAPGPSKEHVTLVTTPVVAIATAPGSSDTRPGPCHVTTHVTNPVAATAAAAASSAGASDDRVGNRFSGGVADRHSMLRRPTNLPLAAWPARRRLLIAAAQPVDSSDDDCDQSTGIFGPNRRRWHPVPEALARSAERRKLFFPPLHADYPDHDDTLSSDDECCDTDLLKFVQQVENNNK